jgi:UDP-N-acetylmuramyl pentapeptide synthase
VGEEFSKSAAGTDFRLFANVDDVRAELESNPVEGETILIKGSNSMNMIKVKDFL